MSLRSILASEGLLASQDSKEMLIKSFLSRFSKDVDADDEMGEIPWGVGRISLYAWRGSDKIIIEGRTGGGGQDLITKLWSGPWDEERMAQAIKSFPPYKPMKAKKGQVVYVSVPHTADSFWKSKIISTNPLQVRISVGWRPWTVEAVPKHGKLWKVTEVIRGTEPWRKGMEFEMYDFKTDVPVLP